MKLKLNVKDNLIALLLGLISPQLAFTQSPQNWILPLEDSRISRQQVNSIFNIEDEIWMFCGRDVYAANDRKGEVRLLSTIDAYHPSIDADKSVYFFKTDTIFASKYADFLKGEISKMYKIDFNKLPNCLSEGYDNHVNISCIAVDKTSNNIWVGTKRHGLFSIVKPSWNASWTAGSLKYYRSNGCKDSKPEHELLSNEINFLVSDSKGRLWIAFDRGLMLKDDDTWEVILPNHNISAITETKDNGIWVVAQGAGKGNQVFVFWEDTRSAWSVEYLKETIPIWYFNATDQAVNILVDHDGDLWGAATSLLRQKKIAKVISKEDLAQAARDGISQEFGFLENLYSSPLCLVEDKNGIIWIGTSSTGVFTLDKAPGLAIRQKKIVRCHNDKNGFFDIIPVEGKSPYKLHWDSRYHRGTLENFTYKAFEDLKADTFHFILTDAMPGDTGYFSLKLDNPPKIKAKITKTKPPSNFKSTDGVVSFSYIKGGRVLRDEQKKLKGYRAKLGNSTKLSKEYVDTLGFGLGPIEITILDTMGCTCTIRDTFLRPQYCYSNEINTMFDKRHFSFSKHSAEFNPGIGHDSLLHSILDILYICPALKINLIGYVGKEYPENGIPEKNLPPARILAFDRAKAIKKILLSEKVPESRIVCVEGGKKDATVDVFFSY